MSSPPSRMCSNFKKTPKLGRTPTHPFALPTALHVFAYKSQKLVLVISGGIVSWRFEYEHPVRTDTVEVFQNSKWHNCVPLPLHPVPCHVLSSTTHATSLEEQNRVVHVIDKFTLHPFPPSLLLAFNLITQNPAVKPPHHHPCGNTVTIHFSPLQQQS